MDTFDSDIIVDIAAKQTCWQICADEGDITIYRLAGDKSDSEAKFVVSGVADVFTVFDVMSYKISKMNLTHFKGQALGQSMGAKVYTSYVGDGANRKLTQQTLDQELVFYDSSVADRGVCGWCANNPCCMGHYYKFTRLVHVPK